MTLQHTATSVCAQGSSLHSWSNTRRKHVALVLSPPTAIATEVGQPTGQDKMVFPNRLQKTSDLGRLEAVLEELSSCPSAAWSTTFKHLNSVFRPKWSITLSQALHFIHFHCTEMSLLELSKVCSHKKKASSPSHHFETSQCQSPSQKHSTLGISPASNNQLLWNLFS